MIKFGTSGWRAVIADEFTFVAVRRVTQAIANYLKANSANRKILVGYDTRFMAEVFAAASAEQLAANGFETWLCDRDTPTPAISYAIRAQGAAGAINFTASHNPPQYCGMKFSTADGAPALPEVTQGIEQELAGLDDRRIDEAKSAKDAVKTLAPLEDYLHDLAAKLDLPAIAKAGLRIAYDPLWGTGRGYLNKALTDVGCEVRMLHDWRDVYFGGHAPEPEAKHLEELRHTVISGGYHLGLSTDGDADRFGILDRDGTFISPNSVITLLVDYLAESRGWTDAVARTVSTTNMVDRVAAKRGIKVIETPVGFKFIGQLIDEDKIAIGGEESAGLSIRGHYPEKDGILACLLVAEMVAKRQLPIQEMLAQIYAAVGKLESGRIGVRLTPELQQNLSSKLQNAPETWAGRRVVNINRTDGVKLIFEDGSWVLMRPSGTEPLVRIYAEAATEQDLEVLLGTGRKYILGESY
ncbi:MAG: phosphoglucomutase/phosphomannomutase family protein [Acidobacteria bacterium]|nr:phosphoglucomutase/phosphomannomutase family protein [Acidobacteriota bacterium]